MTKNIYHIKLQAVLVQFILYYKNSTIQITCDSRTVYLNIITIQITSSTRTTSYKLTSSTQNITIQIKSSTRTALLYDQKHTKQITSSSSYSSSLLQKHHHTNYMLYSYSSSLLQKTSTIQITSSTRTVHLYWRKTSPYKLQAPLVQFFFMTKNITIQSYKPYSYSSSLLTKTVTIQITSYTRTVHLYYKNITIQITSSTRTVLLNNQKHHHTKLQAVLVQFFFTTKTCTI